MYCQIVSVENGEQVPTAGMNTCALMPYSEVGLCCPGKFRQ